MAGTNTRATEDGERPVPGMLLAPAARRPAIVAAAVCAVVVAVLGALFWHQTGPSWLDHAIDGRLHAIVVRHWHKVSLITLLGGLRGVAAMTAALVLGWLAARHWRGAVVTVVAVLAAEGLTEGVLKPLVHRTLEGNLSYPSGHATGTFALATIVMLLLAGPLRRRLSRAVRVLLTVAAFVIAAIVATSMVGLGAHYFTDTIGGAAVAIGTVLTTALVVDRLSPRRRRPADGPAAAARRTGAGAGAAAGAAARGDAGAAGRTDAGAAARGGAGAAGRTVAGAGGRGPRLPGGQDSALPRSGRADQPRETA